VIPLAPPGERVGVGIRRYGVNKRRTDDATSTDRL